jgi:hypothetical protein
MSNLAVKKVIKNHLVKTCGILTIKSKTTCAEIKTSS